MLMLYYYSIVQDNIVLKIVLISVVNHDDFIRVSELAVVNKIDPVGIIGLREMLKSFIWDSNPINYC